MPEFHSEIVIQRPVTDVFEFYCQSAYLMLATTPDWKMRLIEAPKRLHLGARLVVETRRWGLAQRVTSEVTTFEPPALFVDSQEQGPFRKWVHSHRFEAVTGGTRIVDH